MALLGATALRFPPLTLALVTACVLMFWACAWAAEVLLGRRGSLTLALLALGLGWFAEQMGASRGWFFGRYTYTEVLGVRLGDVPLAIPLMWFALSLVGYVMACLILWREPVQSVTGARRSLLTAWLAAMIVTAFDLGADPYLVFVLKAWVMQKTDGGWFGETLQGFAGWMAVAFLIVASFQALRPVRVEPSPAGKKAVWAALLPIGIYTSGLVFQMLFGHPIEIRAIAFFAMGLPTLVALSAWWHWSHAEPHMAAASVDDVPLAAMNMQADPLADRAVAALVGQWVDAGVVGESGVARLAAATRLMGAWPCNGALADWKPDPASTDPVVAAALRDYVVEGLHLPVWADRVQVERAEAIFMEHGPLSCALLFCSSLPECYALPHLAEVLHIAGQLEQHTEYRIRQTAAMVFPVMMKGGLMGAEGSGVAQVLKVRLIHSTIRHLILRGDPAMVRGQVAPGPVGAGVGGMHAALSAHGWDVDRQGLPCNQVELAYTLLTFGYCFLRGMRTLGLGLSRSDEAACLHAWNVMGHVLGVRRELMAWNMDEAAALFNRIRASAIAPLVPGDPRPALGQALMNTMANSIGLPVLRRLPVPFACWLVGPDTAHLIGLDERVSWTTKVLFQWLRGVMGLIDGLVRLLFPQFSLARLVTRVIGYHFLTRFLMDQTRPLALPERVLNPMADAVATWSHDDRAPGWINALEDKLTTSGLWGKKGDRRV